MKTLTIVLSLASAACFAADPGGLPGLVKAKFTGSAFNSSSDVNANAIGYTLYPEEMYASSLAEKTTVAWTGYMKMTGGVTYNFKGCYDDYVTVKVAGNWILSKGSDCQERTGSYTPSATDWYAVEFRVGNNGGAGGCQNSAEYGILWNTSQDSTWRKVQEFKGGSLFKTGRTGLAIALTKTTPVVISSEMRKNDPTVMDVDYIVLSPHDTVSVRALAFQDGERSFWKVVRATEFVNDPDGNPTAQNIGDAIEPNIKHKLAWKVSKDWNTDLAKVKFEVLCSDQAQLPLKLNHIKAVGKYPALTVGVGTQTDADIFNALLWHYAAGVEDLVNTDGYVDLNYPYPNQVDTTNIRIVNRTTIANRMEALRYIYEKMGYEPLEGGNLLSYARTATRKDLWFNSGTQNAVVLKSSMPEQLYVGEKAYCVIDVSGGPNAEKYPVTYIDYEPTAGWGDEYKTTKILLRRCEPSQYSMGITVWTSWTVNNWKTVTLTKPFYIGVFTVTQAQYESVMGSNPTDAAYKGNLRPVQVSWNQLRGDSTVYNWPAAKTVSDQSFVGVIQKKTDIRFDLPTMCQWQYSCRAGTSSWYNNGGSNDNDLRLVGRSWTGDSIPVGQFVPNLWGLFDMHGNVGEWCLDHSEPTDMDPEVDPDGGEEGTARKFCGMSPRDYYHNGVMSSFFTQATAAPSDRTYNYTGTIYLGVRLGLTVSN